MAYSGSAVCQKQPPRLALAIAITATTCILLKGVISHPIGTTSHDLTRRTGRLCLQDLVGNTLVVYPKSPSPSFADQVLALFRERGLRPTAVHEVRELQTALGLVAAETGFYVVPASIERLRRDNVVY